MHRPAWVGLERTGPAVAVRQQGGNESAPASRAFARRGRPFQGTGAAST
jgi:hypothetical protein